MVEFIFGDLKKISFSNKFPFFFINQDIDFNKNLLLKNSYLLPTKVQHNTFLEIV
jgi:hypothetical protein